MICQSADGGLELVDLVGALPRELDVDAAEVTVCGGLRVNRALEVKLVDDRGGTQVEHLAHGLLDLAKVVSADFSINIREVGIHSHDGIFEGSISLYVKDAEGLQDVMTRLRKLKGIESVKRTLS